MELHGTVAMEENQTRSLLEELQRAWAVERQVKTVGVPVYARYG